MATNVVEEFKACLQDPDIAIPVAAFKTLTSVIKTCGASTMMELEVMLRAAADELKQCERDSLGGRTRISLTSGIDMFLRYVTRCFLEFPDFSVARKHLIQRGEGFAADSLYYKSVIAHKAQSFVQDGSVVLTHGCSRVVLELLRTAARDPNRQFSVIVTEGRPDGAGAKTARALAEVGVPVTIILDSAVGHAMENVDLVIVGAEGVVENGGVVNMIGTYQMAIVAKAHNTPFYAAAESYKFARLYPLNQRDLPETLDEQARLEPFETSSATVSSASSSAAAAASASAPEQAASTDMADVSTSSPSPAPIVPPLPPLPKSVQVENPTCDFTPPHYITLLFTDIGVLTPSAVSDELIKLYQ